MSILNTNHIEQIQIQTVHACNLKCPFCPNSIIPQTGLKMTDKLYNKILSDLKEIDFKGRITLYLMNEPLVDNRILELIERTRKIFPDNRINISTNAVLLTDEKINLLFEAGLSDLDISCYDEETLKKYNPIKSDKIAVHNFVGNTSIFYNRGGLVNYGDGEICGYCERPFIQLYITAEGKAVLCCSDYKREVVMGNVNTESLKDIWNSNKYVEYREHLAEGKRDLILCNKCNYKANV